MKTFVVLSILALVALPVWGEQHDAEIEHLLEFIERADCRFDRNGTLYDGPEARAHIERKYAHLRDRIRNAEAFIRYAASESSFSGRKYRVLCGGREFFAGAWLEAELIRYRKTRKAAEGEAER